MNKTITVLGIIILMLISIYSGCIEETPEKKKSNNIYVDINGNGDFTSIQEAINASDDGITIIVRSGIYYEKLNIKKSINLIGEDKNTTIISRNNTGEIDNLLTIETNNSSIENFTFDNGSSTLFSCILLTRSSNNIIKNNNINGFNHGIYVLSYSEKNIISDNFISNNKYGIRIKGCHFNNISKNNIKNNNRGVYCCCGAEYNEIYFNNFFENYEFNGIESSSLTNYWNNNYWDDYNGSDMDDDGYGDTPYPIPSGTDVDLKPLINPFN
jgi:parallel beta-helix repeat protein